MSDATSSTAAITPSRRSLAIPSPLYPSRAGMGAGPTVSPQSLDTPATNHPNIHEPADPGNRAASTLVLLWGGKGLYAARCLILPSGGSLQWPQCSPPAFPPAHAL